MDTVELLRQRGVSYTISLPGLGAYKFFGSVPVKVPRAVADKCAELNIPDQRPMWKVTRGDVDPDIDVDAVFGVEFRAWRSHSSQQ